MRRNNPRLGNVLRSWLATRHECFFIGSRTPNTEQRTTNDERRTKAAPGAAFSLIEVMLALMVVSVGMLAILGLFPMALDQNARAVANSHAALFADEVLSGLHACADDNWASLNANLAIPVAAADVWGEPVSGPYMTNRFTGANVATNIYKLYEDTNIVNHALRYRLALVTNGDIKAATLWVWSGQYGVTSAPIVFYAEFFNMRGN